MLNYIPDEWKARCQTCNGEWEWREIESSVCDNCTRNIDLIMAGTLKELMRWNMCDEHTALADMARWIERRQE